MEILLDGQDWKTEGDFIDAVLSGVEAPPWHGRNYNAIRDSFVAGFINRLSPPYEFVVRMPDDPSPELLDAVAYFSARISDWHKEGAQLSVRVV